MCMYCRQQDDWRILPAAVKNNTPDVQYVVDAFTGRMVEIKPGETREVYAKAARS